MTDPSPVPPPDSGAPEPGRLSPDETPPRSRRPTAIAALTVAAVVIVLGAAVGWFWAAITPRLQLIKTDGGFLYADTEPEQPVAADGTFLLIGLGLGIVLAIVVWVVLRRYRGAAMLAALSLGSLAGSVLAFWVGHKIGVAQFNAVRGSAPMGAQVGAPVTLGVTDEKFSWRWPHWLPSGVVAGQALAAAFVYTSLAGFSSFDDLGRHRRRGRSQESEPAHAQPPGADPPSAPSAE
jgi:hypothetical protein